MRDGRYIHRLIGQPSVVEALFTFLNLSDINRTFLFYGPVSSGKTTAGKFFASDVFDNPRPIRGIHPDLVYLSRSGTSQIDKVKQWRESAVKAPFEAKNIIMLLEEVHMLSSEAGNSLLKLIEEPPAHVTVILTSSSLGSVLDTIKSRSYKISFNELSIQDKVRILKAKNVENPVERAVFSSSLRDAILSDKFLERKEQILDAKRKLAACSAMPPTEVVNMISGTDARIFAEWIVASDKSAEIKSIALQALSMLEQYVRPESVMVWLLDKIVQ